MYTLNCPLHGVVDKLEREIMKLTRFKTKALIKECPFLAEMIGQHTTDVTFGRASMELLATVPNHKDWDGCAGSMSKGTAFHAILLDGSILRDFVAQESESGSNYAHTPTIYRNGETVAAAIDRAGIAGRVEYLVAESYHQNSFSTGWVGNKRALCVHKLPKGSTVAELISAIEAEEAEEMIFEIEKTQRRVA
jgi:hypothetical protein